VPNPESDMKIPPALQLRRAGLRVTVPRVRVLELLRELGGHHAADELVTVLRQRGIRLSRASVFNVLHDLYQARVIMQTDIGPGRAMYEAAETWHHHFVCRACGVVLDVQCVRGEKPCLDPDLPGAGYHIDEAQVIFRGYCPGCRTESH